MSLPGSRSVFALSAAVLLSGPGGAIAQESAAPAMEGEIQLEPVTVTAPTGAAGPSGETAATSEIGRTEIETQIEPGRPSEVLDIMPGVATTTNGGDPGTSVNVRGLQDFGRVKVMIDGAPQNFQKSGHTSNGVFYIDPEMIKSVEVSRGAGSATEGEGSIGGGVDFRTIDAGDVLTPGDDMAARLKGRYTTNGRGWMTHGEAAARVGEAFDVLAAGTWSRIGNYRDGDGNVIPSTWDHLQSGLVKARARPAEGHELTLSAMHYHDYFDDGVAPVRATTVDVGTYNASYTLKDPGNRLIDLSAKAFYTKTDQFQRERVGNDERSFTIGTVGTDIKNRSRFETGAFAHLLSYGFNASRDDVETSDDGLTPSGTRTLWGAFVEEKASYEKFELTGALRYDQFDLGKSSDGRLSPKIVAAVTPLAPVTLFVSYAEAFRAPAVTESLVNGVHPGGPAFEFLPNANLRPEIAHEIEGGANFRFDDVIGAGDKLRAKAVGYRNIVDDYISMKYFPVSSKYPEGAYQYQNIARAKLWGAELEAMYDAQYVFAGLSATRAYGIDMVTGKRLSTIPADRIIATIGARPVDGTDRMVVGARISAFSDTKIPGRDLGTSASLNYFPYQLVDLFASAKITDDISVVVNVDNLFNRQYTQFWNTWPSRGRSGKATLIARF